MLNGHQCIYIHIYSRTLEKRKQVQPQTERRGCGKSIEISFSFKVNIIEITPTPTRDFCMSHCARKILPIYGYTIVNIHIFHNIIFLTYGHEANFPEVCLHLTQVWLLFESFEFMSMVYVWLSGMGSKRDCALMSIYIAFIMHLQRQQYNGLLII